MSQCLRGSSAARLRCYGARTAVAARLLPALAGVGALVRARLSSWLGRTPQSLADRLDHIPFGKGWSEGDAGGCCGLSCSQHHHKAPTSGPAPRAGEKRRRALPWPGELLLSLQVPPG